MRGCRDHAGGCISLGCSFCGRFGRLPVLIAEGVRTRCYSRKHGLHKEHRCLEISMADAEAKAKAEKLAAAKKRVRQLVYRSPLRVVHC